MYVRSAQSVNAASPEKSEEIVRCTPRRTCQIPGCTKIIRSAWLMCPGHWAELPSDMGNAVKDALLTWIEGKAPVRPYLVARLKAIIFIAKLHGQDVADLESKLANWERSPLA